MPNIPQSAYGSKPKVEQEQVQAPEDEQMEENKYDQEKINRMYRFPADRKEARVHKRAMSFGYNSPQMNDGSTTPICPCCEVAVNTIPVPLAYGTIPGEIKAGERRFLLNPGTSMYFTFIKMCIFYLLLRFLICDAYNMWTSSQAHFCAENKKQCTDYFNSYFSGYNKHTVQDEHIMDLIDFLNIGVTLLSIVYFYLCRKYLVKINDLLEQSNITQDDFSILIENIPIFIYEKDTDIQNVKFEYQNFIKDKISQKIKEWRDSVIKPENQNTFTDYIEKDFLKFIVKKAPNLTQEPIVTSVTLCYDMSELEAIDELRKTLMDEYVDDQSVDKDNVEESLLLSHIPNQIKILNTTAIELSKKYAMDDSPSFNLSHFIGKAFVTFQYQHYKEYYLREFKKNKNFFVINTKTIHIEAPAQPTDVYWHNMSVSNEERAKSLIYSYVVMAMFLIFSLVILVGVQQFQDWAMHYVSKSDLAKQAASNEEQSDNASGDADDSISLSQLKSLSKFTDINYIKKQIITYIFVVFLPLITNGITYVITLATEKLTQLEKHKTKTNKVSSLIIKNVLTRFINTAVIYYVLAVVNTQNGPLTQQGFVIKVMGLVGVSAVINMITQLIQPEIIYDYFFNNIKIDENAEEGTQKLFQVQLNKEMQDPEFAFVDQYSFYVSMVLLVSFYAVIAPAGVMMLIVIFILQYWIDKYNLFRRSSCPLDFNIALTKLIFKAFECSILIFAIGTFILDLKIRVNDQTKFKWINLANIGLAGLYVGLAVFAPSRIEQKIFSFQKVELNHRSYLYYLDKKTFRRVYWSQNPVTAFLKQKNINAVKNDKDAYVSYDEDDKFVQQTHYDTFINLKEEDIKYETYDKEEAEYFQQYDDDEDYDSEQEQDHNQENKKQEEK